jgi:hypothetical protein
VTQLVGPLNGLELALIVDSAEQVPPFVDRALNLARERRHTAASAGLLSLAVRNSGGVDDPFADAAGSTAAIIARCVAVFTLATTVSERPVTSVILDGGDDSAELIVGDEHWAAIVVDDESNTAIETLTARIAAHPGEAITVRRDSQDGTAWFGWNRADLRAYRRADDGTWVDGGSLDIDDFVNLASERTS